MVYTIAVIQAQLFIWRRDITTPVASFLRTGSHDIFLLISHYTFDQTYNIMFTFFLIPLVVPFIPGLPVCSDGRISYLILVNPDLLPVSLGFPSGTLRLVSDFQSLEYRSSCFVSGVLSLSLSRLPSPPRNAGLRKLFW